MTFLCTSHPDCVTKTLIRCSSVLTVSLRQEHFPEYLLRLVNGDHTRHLRFPLFLVVRGLYFCLKRLERNCRYFRFSPHDLVSVQLVPVFTGRRPFWNMVYYLIIFMSPWEYTRFLNQEEGIATML